VLRRQLSIERREEIFVSKESLREKLTGLRPNLRSLFSGLGLDAALPGRSSPVPAALLLEEEDDWLARSEISRSEPPPKP
jgi:hypothetical protein